MKGFGIIAIIALVLLAARSGSGGSGGGSGGGVGPPPVGPPLCSASDIRRMNGYISVLVSRGYTYRTLPIWLKIPFDWDYAHCPNFNTW